MQNNATEAPVTGAFEAAAAAKGVQVSSLHKKYIELALLPRTCFGAYTNATARRKYSTKKQKESTERLFVRIQKAVSHPDSCLFIKKQRKQLTSMCLQLPLPNEQQQEAEEMATVPAAVAAAQQVQVKELKTILKKAGLDVEGFKISLLQRVHKTNLMHHLESPRATESLLKSYKVMHGKVGAKDASADKQEAAAKPAAEETGAKPAAEETGAKPGAEETGAEPAVEEAAEPAAEETAANKEDASAEPAAEEPAAEPAAETAAEIALAHINNFYSTSTEGNTGRA